MVPCRPISRPSKDEIVWIKTYCYADMRGRKIEYHLTMVNSKKEPKPFMILDFSIGGNLKPIPGGIAVSNNMEDKARFKVVFPFTDADFMGFSLGQGFRILYLGEVLVTAPPNIRSMEQLVQHEFRKAE